MAFIPQNYPNSLPLSQAENYHKHSGRAQEIQEHILRDSNPRPLTQAEIDAVYNDTLSQIQRIKELQAFIDIHRPDKGSKIHEQLFDARVEYRLRFCRIFRINDLPVEVLANIFRFIAWTSVDPIMSVSWRLTLTSVCRLWREVALADSTLWNAIWLREPPPFSRPLEWFKRAESASLDIRINDSPNFSFDGQTMADLLDKLLVKICQIRILILIVHEREAAQIALEKFRLFGTQKSPLSLERLELHCSSKDPFPEESVDEGFTPLFGGAPLPSLKYISLSGVYLDWKQSMLMNLTILDIRCMPFSHAPDLRYFRAILANSPNLWKLCLHDGGPRWEAQRHKPILLPNLKVLVLAGFTVAYTLYLLRQIQAPNVRDLTLANLMGEDYTPLYYIMMGRFPHVRILTFFSSEVAPSQWMVRWLTSMPELIYLRLSNIQQLFFYFFLQRADPPLVQQSRKDKNDTVPPAVCPNLSVVDLRLVDPDQAIAFIIHRQRLGCPIKKIYISQQMSTKMTADHYQRMRSLAPMFLLEYGAQPPEEELLQS